MKKYFYIFTLLYTCIIFAQTDYYYYNGEKVFLVNDYNQVNIVTANAFDKNSINAIGIQEFAMHTEKEIRNGEYKKIAKLEFTTSPSTQVVYDQKVIELKNSANVEGVYPYYTINANSIGTNNFFAVKLNQPSDVTLLQTVASQKNVAIIRQRTYLPLWYILSTNLNTTENTVELSAYFYETGYFDIVEPAFTGAFAIEPIVENNESVSAELELCYEEGDFDTFQWNLFNNPDYPLADINICGAWNAGIFGQGVKIAVVDNGVVDGLVDLPVSSDDVIASSGLPFDSNFSYISGSSGPHGTKVASIIGAKHNGVGMGGIAPNAEMLYVANEMNPTFSQIEIADGIDEAVNNRHADVFNMSFANNGLPTTYLENALDNALDTGRDGLGAVLVAGSGNEASNHVLQPANYPRVLAVGGTNTIGAWNEYNYGADLDLVAPSTGIVVLDGTGSVNHNFGGTSAASPHVAGVAALMISANTGIVGEGVRNIIKRTAQRDSDPTYGDENNWFSKTGSRNNHLGHGIVDATECVLTAQAFDTEDLDLHMRNSFNDYGNEPENITKTSRYVLWNSPDIWIRNQIEYNYNYENPIYEGENSKAYVYVRVINKSNTNYQTGNATLKLYWSKFHYSNSWPNLWDGSTTINDVVVGGLVADLSGNLNGIPIPSMKPGEEQILIFEWDVPNPDDFNGIFPYNDASDFSFLARIESNDDPIDDVTNPNEVLEGPDVWINAQNNNNITWKNVTVINNTSITSQAKGVNISNLSNETKSYTLEFVKDENDIGKAIYEEAEVSIQLDSNLYQNWTSNGSLITNATEKNQQFKVSNNHVVFDNISLASNEIQSLQISFNFLTNQVTDKKEFLYHFIQRDKETNDIVSSKTFCIKKGEVSIFNADAGSDKEIDKTQNVTLNAVTIEDPAIYNWYDSEGNLIYTGQDFTVSPQNTKQYKLEVIKEADGFKDYDEIQVTVNPFILGSIIPNPVQNEVSINYIAENASSSYLIFNELNTNNTYNFILNTNETNILINMVTFNTGLYFVTLVCDGTVIDNQTLIKN